MEMTTIIQTAINKRLNAVDQLCLPIIKSSIESASTMIANAYLNDGKVITAGNGGSASMSMHFSAELNGRYNDNRNPRRAISLCADMATVTCIANDFGYERIFSRQIESLADKGDVFVAFTTSGKSRNIIEALCQCRAMGVSTISIVGKADDNISKLSDLVIEIPDDNTSIVQEFHLQIVHIIAEIVESMAKEPRDAWAKALSLADEGYHCLLLDRDGVVSRAKANGYVATNPDRVCPTDQKTVLVDCGSLQKCIEHATGRKPDIVLGKPDPTMLDGIMHRHGLKPEEIIMTGDRIYTDTAMAHNAGAVGVLVLSGETTLETALKVAEDARNNPAPEFFPPDLIVRDIRELGDLILRSKGI